MASLNTESFEITTHFLLTLIQHYLILKVYSIKLNKKSQVLQQPRHKSILFSIQLLILMNFIKDYQNFQKILEYFGGKCKIIQDLNN